MSRSCTYRREISEACNWHQSQAMNSTIYILYQTGPTGFLLKEEGENKNFKVFLGSVHNCTCPVFKKEKDLCKHICWVLLKKFRVNQNDPLSWQLGLNEREINQIIRGDTAQEQRSRVRTVPKKNNLNDSKDPNELEQRPITEADVCPICQDELLSKKLPVTYCRYGCGNNVHIKCMKVWADHQKSNNNNESQLKCPLCRETFCSYELLEQEYRNNGLFKSEKPDVHYGLTCKSCHSTPIAGKCYKCTSCSEFYLCQPCFNTDFHNQHNFVFREKINQKYHKASREHVGIIPPAIAQNLGLRDIGDEDYDLLLQLDTANNNSTNKNYSQIPEKVIKSWPSEKVRENSILLSPGYQCRVCLRAFQVNQLIRKLPRCKHKFHIECIDNWLLHSHPTCPIDGQIVWDPITAELEKEEKNVKPSNSKSKVEKPVSEIPSLGLIINFKPCVVENKSHESNKPSTQVNNELSGHKKPPIPNSKNNVLKPIKNTNSANNRAISMDNLSNLRIEVEGRNVNNGIMDNFADYTNTLAAVYTAAANELKNSNRHKKHLQSTKQLSTPPSSSNMFPKIEIKGTKFNENTSFLTSLKIKDQTNSRADVSSTDDVLFRRNSLLNQINSTTPSVYDINHMVTSKPYQLTRLSNITTNNHADNQSDFYVNDDDISDDEYIVNNNNNKQNKFTVPRDVKIEAFEYEEEEDNYSENMIYPDDAHGTNNNENQRITYKKSIKNQKLRTHHPPVLKKVSKIKTSYHSMQDLVAPPLELPSVVGITVEQRNEHEK